MCGKIKQLLVMVLLGTLLFSCKQTERDTRTVENFDAKTNINAKTEDNLEFIADLPIKIDSTSNHIVFQINELKDEQNDKKGYSSRKDYSTNYLKNLIFQNIETEEVNVLTTSKIDIVSYEQLYNAKNEPEKVILYQIIDNFPEDKEALILTSLYLSIEDGKGFKKISLHNHQLGSWKYFPEMRKIFFKTVEDSDKNNKLDNLDEHHIYSVSIDDFKSTELLKEEFKMISH